MDSKYYRARPANPAIAEDIPVMDVGGFRDAPRGDSNVLVKLVEGRDEVAIFAAASTCAHFSGA